MISLPDLHGTYIFFGRLNAAVEVTVGCIGKVSLSAGDDAYAGSTFCPGGIAARVDHHLQGVAAPDGTWTFCGPI